MYTLNIDNFVFNTFGQYSLLADKNPPKDTERIYRNKKIDDSIKSGEYLQNLRTKIEISKIIIEDNIKELSKIQEDLEYIERKYKIDKK